LDRRVAQNEGPGGLAFGRGVPVWATQHRLATVGQSSAVSESVRYSAYPALQPSTSMHGARKIWEAFQPRTGRYLDSTLGSLLHGSRHSADRPTSAVPL